LNDFSGAAEAYSAALAQIDELFDHSWGKTDWSDGPLSWRFYFRKGVSSPTQGWKVHVSASAADSPALLTRIAPALCELGASFKVPRAIRDVVFLNSGDAGVEQLGKIATIYPRDDRHARDVVRRVDGLWPRSLGPEVRTDLHLMPGSAVSLRYGAFGSGPVVVGSTGIYEFALTLPDGSLVADQRHLEGRQPSGVPPPPVQCCPPVPCPIGLKQTVRLGMSNFVVLLQISETPQARIFLAADRDTLESVILKTGHPGVAGDLNGRDVRDLMKKEYEILATLAGGGGIAPRALHWRDGQWPILAMEDFRGGLLSELPQRERIECLPELARALAVLHKSGFVHGDVKLENAVRRSERVGLIDFELAEPIGAVPRAGGTPGYLAPEVNASYRSAPKRDIFALGGCIFQAVADFPPGLLPDGVWRISALLRNEGAPQAATLAQQLLAADPCSRPAAHETAIELTGLADALSGFSVAGGVASTPDEFEWCRSASLDAAGLVRRYEQKGPQGTSWRNTHFMRSFDCEAINLGAAGVILGLASIDGAYGQGAFTEPIDQGARWLSNQPASGKAAGVFTGNAGVALALAVAGRRLGTTAYLSAARRRFEAAAADRREIDLFSGSAGVVWAGCILSDILREQWPLDCAQNAAAHLMDQAGVVDGIPVWSVDRDTDTRYLGCAHGAAGVAMALGCWGRRVNDRACVDTALEAFRAVAGRGRTTDGKALRIATNSSRHHAAGNWCHGVGGYLWAVLIAMGDNPELRGEIDWAVGALREAASIATPTYCHGLAGHLELWRMLQDVARHRDLAVARAGKVVRALRILHHKIDGRCAWISDDPAVTTPDLWIGFLGPATALALHAAGIRAPLLSGSWLSQCSVPTIEAIEAAN
jgi:class IV lanthipeptide synthase